MRCSALSRRGPRSDVVFVGIHLRTSMATSTASTMRTVAAATREVPTIDAIAVRTGCVSSPGRGGHRRGRAAKKGAHDRANENVGRVVHARVHAGKGHDRRCATQRKPERRQQVSDRNRKRGGGRGVARRKRRRRRHCDPSLLRHAEAVPIRAVAFADQFHGLVDYQGRRSDSRKPGERGTSTIRSAEHGQEAGGDEPWFGEVGEARHPPQRLIQLWGGQPRHRTVDGPVTAAEAAQQRNGNGCARPTPRPVRY